MPANHPEPEAPVIMGIDTSGTRCVVGITRGTNILFACEFFQPFLHDAALAEICEIALRHLQISIHVVSSVAVVIGPGSFTGLRIGVSFARALCLSLDEQDPPPRCISLSTMEILAVMAAETAQLRQKSSMIVVVPSHKNLVYAQKFTVQAEAVEPLQLVANEDLFTFPDSSVLYCGQGLQGFAARLGDGLMVCEIEPKVLLQCALQKFQAGNFADPMTMIPHYGQEFIPRQG